MAILNKSGKLKNKYIYRGLVDEAEEEIRKNIKRKRAERSLEKAKAEGKEIKVKAYESRKTPEWMKKQYQGKISVSYLGEEKNEDGGQKLEDLKDKSIKSTFFERTELLQILLKDYQQQKGLSKLPSLDSLSKNDKLMINRKIAVLELAYLGLEVEKIS